MQHLLNGFTDIHSHLLPVQDGPEDMEQAIKALRIAEKSNITDVILTPHYYSGDTAYNQNYILTVFENLKAEIVRNNLKVRVYLGNECVVDEKLIDDLKAGKALTMNQTQYVLCEYPLYQVPCNYNNILYKLMDNGYKPIIAHPERNASFDKNYESLQTLRESGCMIQLNIGSVLGQYGSSSKRNAFRLLKDKVVDFMATDAHSHATRSPKSYSDAYRKLRRYYNHDDLMIVVNKGKKICMP